MVERSQGHKVSWCSPEDFTLYPTEKYQTDKLTTDRHRQTYTDTQKDTQRERPSQRDTVRQTLKETHKDTESRMTFKQWQIQRKTQGNR